MPELPEVQTTVNGLNETVIGKTIASVWSDLPTKNHSRKTEIKNLDFWNNFKKKVVGKKIIESKRRGKNILMYLENDTVILIHLKMTGHLMFGKYRKGRNSDGKVKHNWVWWGDKKPLQDPFNRFIHFLIKFTDETSLAFSDSRKFGKVSLLEKNSPEEKSLLKLGPDAMDKNLTQEIFKKQTMKQPNRSIKTVLLNQNLITGIGNIYSDEMLWVSGIHPERKPTSLTDNEWARLFKSMKPLFQKGLDMGGDSMSDYRNIYGEKGQFHHTHNAYRLTGNPCSKKSCTGVIDRKVINGRSGHFCNEHQK